MQRTKTNIRRSLRFLLGTSMRGRVLRGSLVFLMVFSITLPIVQEIMLHRRYQLDSATQALIGKTNPNLAQKITFDAQNDQWQFNKDGIITDEKTNPITTLKNQVGGGGKKDTSLYSVDLPRDASKGVTYYDNNTQLSFKLIPTFSAKSGREVGGRLVYPIDDGAKLIYTAKNNGMKEDIVLTHNIGDSVRFAYDMHLPKTLEARLQDDGSVGIFSANPALFGSITFGTNADEAKVKSARETATKDHLLFALPPPVIKQSGNTASPATGQFRLEGGDLVVYANHLSHLTYPVTVDPSVVITSSSDFGTGDYSGNIDYPTGQINRGAITGGSLASWNSTSTGSYTARFAAGNVAYNGYIYLLGGNGITNSDYAPINSNGSIGAWAPTTALPGIRYYGGAAAYNGYMYVFGGVDNGTAAFSSVIYAPINSSTGALGSWVTSANAMNTAACKIGWAIYNGYLYATGGNTGTVGSGGCANSSATQSNAVQYAPILASGDVGAWSTSSNTFTNVRQAAGSVAYNGFLYVIGGTLNGITIYRDVQYAPILASGDVGAWVTSASQIPGTNYRFGIDAYNGYIYQSGGAGTGQNTTTSFAPIKANGDIGTWTATSVLGTPRYAQAFAAYNGYIYNIGGFNSVGATAISDTLYAKIDDTGKPSAYTTSGNAFTTTRRGMKAIANNGYLYVMGGDAGGAPVATVYKSTLATDGTLGAFSITTSMPASLTFFAATAYQGYMYVVGGCTSAFASCTTGTNDVATVYSSPINASDGTLGTWVTQTSFSTGRYGLATAAYNGYLYVLGGVNASTFQSDIQYHAIAASGTISGAWTTSAKTIATARAYFGATTHGGRLYLAGGCSAGALTCTTSQNDIQYASLDSSGDLSATLTTNGTSFSNTRGGMELVISTGYAYIVGGWDGTTYYADTQYAPVNSNGSLGTWVSGTSITNARYGLGTAVYNGVIYAAGGYNGTTYYNTVQYAYLNNGGGGAVGSWASAANTFTTARSQHATIAYRGYLYVMGGDSSGALSSVQYAALNPDGTVGTWGSTTALPFARQGLTAFANNRYIYVAGGRNSSTYYNDVQYAPVNSDGTLGAWASTTSFTTGRAYHGSATYGGYAYIIGGTTASGVYANDTQYAAINSDGTIGTWASTTAFTNARGGLQSMAANGYIYMLGGYDGSMYYNDVQYAALNAGNGTIGTWNSTAAFSTGRQSFGAVIQNGFLYVLGGTNGTRQNDTQYAAINADGSLSNWSDTKVFSTARQESTSIAYGGYLYVVGGYTGSYQNDIQYAPINSIGRVGYYSKIVNMGSNVVFTGLSYNGIVPGELASVGYKLAGTNGVLGSLLYATDATSVISCNGASPSQGQYILLFVKLDDSSGGAFPDSSTTPAYLTDITTTYAPFHPDPNVRLHQGKYFAGEVLQPLDTCQ